MSFGYESFRPPLAKLRHRYAPTSVEAMLEMMRAFPSWFLRIECDRCGKIVMHNESNMTEHQRGIVLRVLLNRMRHDGCGGRPFRA